MEIQLMKMLTKYFSTTQTSLIIFMLLLGLLFLKGIIIDILDFLSHNLVRIHADKCSFYHFPYDVLSVVTFPFF